MSGRMSLRTFCIDALIVELEPRITSSIAEDYATSMRNGRQDASNTTREYKL